MKPFGDVVQRCIPYGQTNHQWPQVLSIAIATLGSFVQGAIFNWTSPAIPVLISTESHLEPMTLEQVSYFTVIPTATAMVVSPIIAILTDKIGRKKTVFLIPTFYCLSWALIAFAGDLYVFYLARLIQGVGDAGCFTALPMYVGEIAEPKIRGTWGNLISLSMFSGFLAVNTIGAYCSIKTTAYIFGFVAIIGMVLALLVVESPHYLIMRGREEEARSSLRSLRWKQNVDEELALLVKDVQREIAESGKLMDLFTDPTNLKTLIISVGLRASQPLSGLPAFTMYTQYMFAQAGTNISASTSAIIFSGVFCLFMTGFSSVVERLGRKPLMTFSCFGCGVVLLIEGAYFYMNEKTNLDVSGVNWLPLAGLLTYIPLSASGIAMIPTLMLGELFSTSIKGKALCVLNICYMFFILLVAKLFPTLSVNFGMYVPFCLFSACCFANVVFSYYCIPETKGKTLEEIQRFLRGDKNDKGHTNSTV